MDQRQTIDNVMSRQDGIISLEQARAWGMTQAQTRHQVDRGSWVRLFPGVFASATHRLTARGRIRSASLWAGDTALLSGIAAAWWWGLQESAPTQLEFTIAPGQRLRPRSGIAVRRRRIDYRDRAHHDGLTITGRPLTVLMASIQLGTAGRNMVDRALQTGVGLAHLEASYQRNSQLHGASAMRDLLAALDGSAAESERLLMSALKTAGIHGWVINHRLVGTNSWPDFTFAAARLIVEVDGWAWHHSPERFQRDRSRQNALVLDGWKVLRFTWADLTERPAWVITQIRRALGGPT